MYCLIGYLMYYYRISSSDILAVVLFYLGLFWWCCNVCKKLWVGVVCLCVTKTYICINQLAKLHWHHGTNTASVYTLIHAFYFLWVGTRRSA